MIHIASVHWQTGDWIDLQLKYLNRHVSEPFRVYAFLNGVPDAHRSKFHYASTEPIREHAVKLNRLADVIRSQGNDEDILIFLDGDAFPVADVMPVLGPALATRPLVAVQRLENNGDRQPHPCFCATTVGFWKSIGGDWREGHTWLDQGGKPTTDVGGNLLGQLEGRGLDWLPLLRTNRRNLHPVWFGVYGDLIYHHGAGFRPDKLSRADLRKLADERADWHPLRRFAAAIKDRLAARSPVRALRNFTPVQRIVRRNAILSEEFFGTIKANERFYEALIT